MSNKVDLGRFQSQWFPKDCALEENDGTIMVVPDMALSPEEILQKFVEGNQNPVQAVEVRYGVNENIDSPDPAEDIENDYFDLVDAKRELDEKIGQVYQEAINPSDVENFDSNN